MNWFYRGFNRVYGAVERRYIGVVQLDGAAPAVDGLCFLHHRRPGRSCLCDLSDRARAAGGPRITVSSRRGFPPALRSRACAKLAADIDALLKDIPGIKGWVTIGGYSALDSAKLANVVTAFVMYQDWDQRPPGVFPDESFSPTLQKKLLSIRNAQVAVLPPSPIPGLGNAFGFQMVVEDRGGAGLGELQKTVQEILGIAQRPAGFSAHRFYHLQRQQPAALPGHRPDDGEIARGHGQRCLQDAADLFRIDLRQPVQQVQPELPGPRAVRGRLSPAVGGHRQTFRRQPVRADGAARQLARRAPGARVGADHALQPLSRRDDHRRSHAEVQLRRGARFHGADRRERLPPRHGLRMDRTLVPGEARLAVKPTSSSRCPSRWSSWCSPLNTKAGPIRPR